MENSLQTIYCDVFVELLNKGFSEQEALNIIEDFINYTENVVELPI